MKKVVALDRLCKFCASAIPPTTVNNVKTRKYCSSRCRYLAWVERQFSVLLRERRLQASGVEKEEISA